MLIHIGFRQFLRLNPVQVGTVLLPLIMNEDNPAGRMIRLAKEVRIHPRIADRAALTANALHPGES